MCWWDVRSSPPIIMQNWQDIFKIWSDKVWWLTVISSTALNYGMATTQTRAASTPNLQEKAEAKSDLCSIKTASKELGVSRENFTVITLDSTVLPMIHPPHWVPKAPWEPLKKETDLLSKQGIIAKFIEPTDWVNSLVCVTKSNCTLQLCPDRKDLNCAIKCLQHCTPTLRDVLQH